MNTGHRIPATAITAIVLAGGRASRMGGVDKGQIEFRGRPLVEHVLEAIAPQVGRVIISANRNLERYRAYGHAVVSDCMDGFAGPLAGIASGMQATDTPLVLCVPCDAPFVPDTLAAVLAVTLAAGDAEICVAHDGARMQQLFALLRRTLLPALQDYLAAGGRRVDAWYESRRLVTAGFHDHPQAFTNLNSAADLHELMQQAELPRAAGS